jgi:RNA binding exosome subunit
LFQSKTDERRLKGHHGNEIHVMTITVPPSKTRGFAEYLWERLSSLDKQSTLDSIERHLDEKNVLHLRLSKQDSFLGHLALADEDVIKIELVFRASNNPDKKASDEVKELLEQLDDLSNHGSQQHIVPVL